MSSSPDRRPDFRLTFADQHVRLSRGCHQCEVVSLGDADLVRRLRAFGCDRLAARARLTVVLPGDVLWEAALPLPRWNPVARRRAARAAAAAAIGADAPLAIALGRHRRDGTTPVAALPLERLREMRGFLAPLGLAPDRLRGALGEAGFRGWPRGLALPAAPALPAMPRLGELRLPAGLLAPLQRQDLPRPMLLGGGLIAAAALGVALWPVDPPEAVGTVAPVATAPASQSEPAPTAQLPAAERVAALGETPRHRPAHLPRLAAAPAPASAIRVSEAAPRPARVAPAAGESQVLVTMASRSMPVGPLRPLPAAPRGDAGPRIAEVSPAAAVLTDVSPPARRPVASRRDDTVLERIGADLDQAGHGLRPRWRPAPAAAAASAETPVGAAAAATREDAVVTAARPEPRPAGLGTASPAVVAAGLAVGAAIAAPRPRELPARGEPARVAAADPAAFVSAGRPAPRNPAPVAPVRVASLAPAADFAAAARLSAAPVGPAVRSAVAAAAAAPGPVPVAAPAPVRAAAPVRKLPAAPLPAVPQASAQRQPAPKPQVVVTRAPAAKPAGQHVASLGPVATPVRTRSLPAAPVAKAPAAAKPVATRTQARSETRTARATPVREKVGLQGRGASLIGIFGDADARYALVRTGRGKVEKVKAGDHVDGALVASVGKDAVTLDGRKDTILRLPD